MHLFQGIKVLDKTMLRKILFFLFSFTLFIVSGLPSPKPVRAQITCADPAIAKSTTDSTPAHDSDKLIYLEINPNGGIRESEVSIFIKYEKDIDYSALNHGGSGLARIPLTDGKIIINKFRKGGFFYNTEDDGIHPFPAGNYSVMVVPAGRLGADKNSAYCITNFQVAGSDTDPGSDNYCEVSYSGGNNYTIPDNAEMPDTKVGIKVTFHADKGTNTNPTDTHRVSLVSSYSTTDWDARTDELTADGGWTIPNSDHLSAGTYNIVVREFATHLFWPFNELGKRCSPPYPFLIQTLLNGGGYECSADTTGCDYKDVKENKPLSQPCDEKDFDAQKGCLKIKTALGTVGTGTTDFVKWVLGFVLGISGGIVLIIIIITGYRLMTSQGDPEKVKNAREQLTAAIVGLLFIIFSLVILQLITQDILQLPGFGS